MSIRIVREGQMVSPSVEVVVMMKTKSSMSGGFRGCGGLMKFQR
jgi:hypothetical protein